MFDNGRARKKRADDGAPLGKRGRLAKADGMVFQRVPKNLQDVALRAFDAPVDLEACKTAGLADHRTQTTLDRFLKGGVLAGRDANVG